MTPVSEPTQVWTRQRPGPRRRAPDADRIVAAAIAIADVDGLAAVSMRRVAAELGSGTASLYRCMANRDELVELMIDTVRGEGEPWTPSGDWRADLSSVARRLRTTLLRHPWLSAGMTGRPALGPNSLRGADTAHSVVVPLTTDATLAAQIVDTVSAYVLGSVATEIAEIEAQRRTGLSKREWQESVGPYIQSVIATGDYPHFARRVIEAEHTDAQDRFEFGLGCVLDGIAAQLPTKA